MRRNNYRAFRITALVCVMTLPVATADGAWSDAALLLSSATALSLVSFTPRLWNRPSDEENQSQTQVLAEIAVSWLVVAVTAAAVTWLLAANNSIAPLTDPTSAAFEAVSGVTTTGLTMLPTPDEVPPTIQFWRTAMQWVGGIGVVVFALTAAEKPGDRDSFLDAQWSAARLDDHPATAARKLLGLYAGLTLTAIGGLAITGSTLWVALNHGSTAIATGGFAVTNDSAASMPYGSQIVLCVASMVSAVSFATLWGTAHRQGPRLIDRTQFRWGLGIFATGASASLLAVWIRGGDMSATIFNAASASSTAGFSIGSGFAELPALGAIAITTMVIGGAAGSTAGGLKTARVVWLIKACRRWLPQGGDVYEQSYTWDGDQIEPGEAAERISGAAALAVVWLLSIVGGTFALTLASPVPLSDALFEATSALSGVGLSSGLTDQTATGPTKVVLGVLMLVGRVEVTAFAALVAQSVHRG